MRADGMKEACHDYKLRKKIGAPVSESDDDSHRSMGVAAEVPDLASGREGASSAMVVYVVSTTP